MNYSTLEFNTAKKALFLGYRSDNRKFDEPRNLKISCSQSPGFALVQLGKTMVTARTLAYLDVPPPTSPNKGQHTIKVYGPPFIKRSDIDTFQTNLRMIWRAINALEEDTLCVKIGEKVWKLTTQIVINDRDGGLIDASIIAIYVSLSQIYFPSFDTSTGNLYPPSQRRTHKVAFSIKPICVTVAFINKDSKSKEPTDKKEQEDKDFDDDYDQEEEEEETNDNDNEVDKDFVQPQKSIIVDPTSIEFDSSVGFATFIITEHDEQVYLFSKNPGNIDVIDEARKAAIEASSKWRKIIEKEIDSFNKKFNLEGLPCVGDPADFIDYKPKESSLKNLGKTKSQKFLDNIDEFKLWKGEAKEKFVIDFFKFVDGAKENNDGQTADTDNDGEDWLHASLIA